MKESGDIYRVSNRTEYEQGISEDVSRGERDMGALYLHLEFWLLTKVSGQYHLPARYEIFA